MASSDARTMRSCPASREPRHRRSRSVIGLGLRQFRRNAEPPMLTVRSPDEPRDDRVHQIVRHRPHRRHPRSRAPPQPPIRDRQIKKLLKLRPIQKRSPTHELAIDPKQRDAGQPAQVITLVNVGPHVSIHLHGQGQPLHHSDNTRILPGLLIHPMTRMTPPSSQNQQHRPSLTARPRKRSLTPLPPSDSQTITPPVPASSSYV